MIRYHVIGSNFWALAALDVSALSIADALEHFHQRFPLYSDPIVLDVDNPPAYIPVDLALRTKERWEEGSAGEWT